MSAHVETEGQEEWIRSVVERYSGALTRYANSITGDMEGARDAVQETFVRLCREERGRVEGHLRAWLFKVCRTRALDLWRKEVRTTALDATAMEREPDRDPSPGERAESAEATRFVWEALETLPRNQHDVVRLKFQNGLSYKEIAEVTGLSVGNVGFLLHTALKAVRRRLGQHFETLVSPGADGR